MARRSIRRGQPKGDQVISPQAAYMLTSVLTDDAARVPVFNVSQSPDLPRLPVAAKTGTSQGPRGRRTS